MIKSFSIFQGRESKSKSETREWQKFSEIKMWNVFLLKIRFIT
jgi:hypothetical protein